jgi:hypothetical protein
MFSRTHMGDHRELLHSEDIFGFSLVGGETQFHFLDGALRGLVDHPCLEKKLQGRIQPDLFKPYLGRKDPGGCSGLHILVSLVNQNTDDSNTQTINKKKFPEPGRFERQGDEQKDDQNDENTHGWTPFAKIIEEET